MWLVSLIVPLLLLLGCSTYSKANNSLSIEVQPSTHLVAGNRFTVLGIFSDPIKSPTEVKLKCKGERCLNVLRCPPVVDCKTQVVDNNYTSNEMELFSLKTFKPGVVTLYLETNSSGQAVDTHKAFTNLSVGHSVWIIFISDIAGWVYFLAWSVSFYPQIWTNYKRRSVIGLNFDFLSLNLTGFLFYSTFSFCLYFLPSFQSEFYRRNPQTNIPVEANDVAFGVHAVFAVIVTVFQCFLYERGTQRVSTTATVILTTLWTGAALLLAGVHFGWLTKLDYIYYFSYSKVLITIFKYMPQAFYNYKRQSTVGWSIGNILLDFAGGILSILQMFLLSYNYEDWSGLLTNFSKFGIGLISISFDILFIVQHYCLYSDKEGKKVEEDAHLYNNGVHLLRHGAI